MNLISIMRLSYVLGWVFAAIAVIWRGLEIAGITVLSNLRLTSRGVLIFAAFLFVASIASATYAQAATGKSKGAAA